MSQPLTDRFLAFLQTLGTLILLTIALPINLALVLIAFVWNRLSDRSLRHHVISDVSPKTVLLTGGKMTKALQLARSFHAAGHRVILVETKKYWLSGHRFSNAIDRFYTIPAPQADPDAFIQSLVTIAQQEKVDLFIPVTSPVESYYCSLAKPALSQQCEVFHFDVETTTLLDNKFTFTEKARSFGLPAPETYCITDVQQILDFDFSRSDRQYILKSIPYNSVYRLDLTKLPMSSRQAMVDHVRSLPISSEQPWIMQEFIAGQEYCTHSTVRDGQITLHCCSKSSAFQVNYQHVDHPQILEWVTTFVKALNLTGQISFDFIERGDGTVFAIECNPRTHSAITMFYNHPGVADAYLNPELPEQPIQPLPTSKPTYWTYHEIWRLTGVRSLRQFQEWCDRFMTGTDAILKVDDPLPFLTVHHWQIPLLLLKNLQQGKRWIRIDFNIGKLVELGGD